MPFNLKVIFTGLCAFVEHTDGTRAKVLLIDGRNKILSTDPDLIHCCPVIRFNRADLDPSSPRQADVCRDGFRLEPRDSICFLDGEDLEIRSVRQADTPAPPALSFRRGNRIGDDPEPNDETRGDWSWVADLDRIRPEAGTPQEWWFVPTPTPDRSLPRPPILARFDLDRGELSTLEFFRHREDRSKPGVFDFNGGRYRQALASFVQCEIECEDGTGVQISSTLFGGQAGRALIFAPRSTDLVIEVSNAPFFDLTREFFPDIPKEDLDWSFPEDAFGSGFSFQHFYQLQRPFMLGEVPGEGNRALSGLALTRALGIDIDKGVGCSPTRTGTFNFI